MRAIFNWASGFSCSSESLSRWTSRLRYFSSFSLLKPGEEGRDQPRVPQQEIWSPKWTASFCKKPGKAFSDLPDPLPPVIVVALTEHLLTGEAFDKPQIFLGIVETKPPRVVTGDQKKIVIRNQITASFGYPLRVILPMHSELGHRLVTTQG